jgi:hypothetical protein
MASEGRVTVIHKTAPSTECGAITTEPIDGAIDHVQRTRTGPHRLATLLIDRVAHHGGCDALTLFEALAR